MNLIGALIGGTVGGLVGGAIWALVAYGTGYEIGYIAWGIGILVGLGVLIGSKGTAGQPGGVLAAVLALASILLAKYCVVELLVNKHFGDMATMSASDVPGIDDQDYWISYVADQLAEQREAAGQAVNWPEVANPEDAPVETIYPKELWADAKARWMGMTPEARAQFREASVASIVQQSNQLATSLKSMIMSEGFLQSFGPIDLVFGLLAVATAFKVGSSEKALGAPQSR